jgi:hypothetical protein
MCEDKLPAVYNTGEVRPGKRDQRQFRMRSLILLITLAALWLELLVDAQIGPLVLYVVGAFGVALVVMAVAMALGFLGFGIFAVSDRLAGFFHRASNWPEE